MVGEKINVGQAIFFDERNMEVQLNITALLKALETEEVQAAMRHFVNSNKEAQASVKLLIFKLETEFENPYQTHGVRIDTHYRQKR